MKAGMGDTDESGDDDFEAELARITGKPKAAKPKAAQLPVNMDDLDRMVAASLADVDTDADSADENDPTLLGELNAIAGGGDPDEESPETTTNDAPVVVQGTLLPTSDLDMKAVLSARLQMYQLAESTAKATGDSGKARRFQRGTKTIQDLLKQVNAGRTISQDDIPPEISVKTKSADPSTPPAVIEPTRSAPPVPEKIAKQEPVPQQPLSSQSQALSALNARKEEYKLAAVQCKKDGDKDNALKLVKILKLMDMAIAAVNAGEVIDLSEMPPPPAVYLEMERSAPATTDESMQKSAPTVIPEQAAAPPPAPATSAEAAPLVMATTIDGALIQRLEKYKSVEAAAKTEGNTSKARRFGRIVKQYEDAIKLYKAGKTVNYEELPTPPGFGPLPLGGGGASAVPPVPSRPTESASSPDEESRPSPSPAVRPKPAAPSPSTAATANRASGNLANTTLMQKQIDELLRRQSEFKAAAIAAKKDGDLEEAKEYLRLFKGFDKLLETARGGFPVDMSTLPIPPGKRGILEDSFEVVTGTPVDDDSGAAEDDGEGDLIDRLLDQLKKQLTMCKETRDHHRAMGDVPGTNKFENLALSVQKDIDIVKYVRR